MLRSGFSPLSAVEAHGHLLAWALLLCWALVTDGFRQGQAPQELRSLGADLQVIDTTTVDLGVDPVSRMVLIEGIGPVTARKIEAARTGESGYRCLCQVMRVPGVPDGPLLEAGPWVSPRPCPGFSTSGCRWPSAEGENR